MNLCPEREWASICKYINGDWSALMNKWGILVCMEEGGGRGGRKFCKVSLSISDL